MVTDNCYVVARRLKRCQFATNRGPLDHQESLPPSGHASSAVPSQDHQRSVGAMSAGHCALLGSEGLMVMSQFEIECHYFCWP
jgi:hypothetical protein